MKVEKIIEEPIYAVEVRLLTKEEAEELPERLRLYNVWWWTSTACTHRSSRAFLADGYSGTLNYGSVAIENAVRPALAFESKDLKIGDIFYFGDKKFEVIKEGLAFCFNDIGESAFRANWSAKDANQYEASDIKKVVDEWFTNSIS